MTGIPQQVQIPGMTNQLVMDGVPQQGQQYIIQDPQPQQVMYATTSPGGPPAVIMDQGAPGAPQMVQQVVQQPAVASAQVVQEQATVKHIPLVKVRALYLGSAVPMETAVGLEALQQPLRERYHTGSGEVPGIDCWVTGYSSGIKVSYISKDNNEQPSVWFPIQTLHVCAAVKAIDLILANKEKQTRFIALDSDNGKKSEHPPIFAAIMRRTVGRKILEAHVFVAKCNAAAMALVKSATHAYEHKEGWTEDEPDDIACPEGTAASGGDRMRLLAADPQQHKERDAPPEFYNKTPQQGYYYTPNKDLVKNYNIHGGGGPPRPALPPPGPPPMLVPAMPEPVGYFDDFGGYGPPPLEYFDDWGAFSGPVSIFGPPPPLALPPPDFYGPPVEHRKPKKKKKRRNHECCEDSDDDDRQRYDCYPDHHYREYREKHKGRRRDGCDHHHKHHHSHDRREYREPPRERYYDDPYYREDRFPVGRPRYDYGDELLFYGPAYMEGDVFYDGYGGGYGGGGGFGGGGGGYRPDPYGYEDMVDRFGRSWAY